MVVESVEVLQARVAVLERRLQLISDELSAALSQRGPAPANRLDDGGPASDFGSEVAFDADSLSPFSQGFYEREYDESGKMFRWTGNGPLCELRFFLDRTEDRAFRMWTGATPPEVLSQLRGFVDYAPIAFAVEKDGDDLLVAGVVPKRSYTRLVVLTFLLGQMPLRRKTKHEENQWLGFRFYSFHAG
jgi:hypothetical protein